MKNITRIIICVMLVLVAFYFTGCLKKEVNIIEDIEEFENLISEKQVLKYDIRITSECEIGHIPSFMCMGPGTIDSKNQKFETLVKNIEMMYEKNKKILVVANDDEALRFLEMLQNVGYKNLYCFRGGYERYVSLKGDTFVPEIGCDC